ncbi:MAG: hypothetical protein GYB33_09670 [Gammaproteobacteria bacterium]|nr:hypothetical protein [Gammaproteobacteria bacterium]
MSSTSTIDNLSQSILSVMGELSDNVDEMSAQLVDVENQISDVCVEASQVLLRAKMFVHARESEAEQGLNRLSSAVERVQADAVAELASNIEDTSSSVRDLSNELIVAIESVREMSAAKRTELENHFDQLKQTKVQFEDAVSQSSETCTGIASVIEGYANQSLALVGEMESLSTEITRQVKEQLDAINEEAQQFIDAELIEHADQRIREITEAVQTLITVDLVKALQEGGSEFQTLVQDSLMEKFRQLLDELSAVVDEVIESLHAATSNSTAEREALSALIDQIEQLSGPLTNSLDTVRDIASAVGIDI